MIRRKVSLLLAILMVITTMTVGFTPTAAGSDNGITTDISAPYDEYEEIRKLKQKDQTDPENNEPRQIGCESLYTKNIDNGDGTKTLEVYGEPVRYITKDGSVKDISLTPVRDGAGFRTGDHRLSISFPEKAEDGINLNTGEHVITATPVTENGTAVKTGSSCLSDTDAIVYRKDSKTSYEYNITYSGYKENIVVSEYTGQTDYYFRIETDGLLLVASEGDPTRGAGLELKDADGRTVARIGNIIVFSSDNRNNTFGSISFETVTEGDEYIIRISVPESYLSDPTTHYPIYIDPTITVAYNANNSSTWDDIEDITVNQNTTADSPTSGTLYVGKAGPNYGAMRSVMRFPELELYGIIPSSITSATVNVRDLMCYGYQIQVDCYGYGGTLPSTAFTTSNMTWSAIYNTMQYYESNNVYRSTNTVSYGDGCNNPVPFWYEFNILPVVQSWAQGRNAGTLAKTDQAIVFKATDSYEQSTSTQYVCFGSYERNPYQPYLIIQYLVTGGVNFSGATEIVVDQSSYVNITDEYEKRFFSFTPESTGFYSIKSYGIISGNPEGYLYNDGEQCLAIGDDIEPDLDDYNFGITYHLRENVTYYLAAGCCEDGIGSYYISISEETTSFYNNLYLRRAVLGNSYSFPASLEYEVHYYLLYSSESIEALLFSSDKISDPCVWIYNSSFSLVASNDDGAGNLNFRASLSLADHQKYYVVIGNYEDETGSFMFNTAKDPNLATAVYYIKNSGTGYYTAIHGPTAESFVHQFTLGAGLEQRWTISKQNDGYYTIKSKYGAEKYIGVTGNASGTDNVQLFSTVSDSTRWKVFTKSGGDVLLEPKTAAGMIVWAPNGIADTELQLVRLSIDDSNSKHLWKPIRMLPTNGSELDYLANNSNNWANYVEDCCNCYAYAINNQVFPGTNYLWYMQQMGYYKGSTYTFSALTKSNISEAVLNDYSQYNSNYNTSLIFQEIGRYEVCPTGTYKVALVVSDNDYHWYRQDSDGFWSHKPGRTEVTRKDSGEELIIDPQIADRGDYYDFLGYYAVSPWNQSFSNTGVVNCYYFGYIIPYDELMSFVQSQSMDISSLQENVAIALNLYDDVVLCNFK